MSKLQDETPATFYYAPEIELAAVSMLWHQPHRCGEFFQRLDPAVHLREPRLRIVAKAIDLAWRELGATDWATVVQVVRELGGYEECGGTQGLNQVYSVKLLRSHEPDANDRLFAHYLEMLKTYARARSSIDHFPVARFTSGSGLLAPNKNKRRALDPDFLGSVKIASRHYSASARIGTDGLTLIILPA